MIPVISDTVVAVSYDAGMQVMRVRFRSGGTYDYSRVAPELFEAMLPPHPWRRVGRLVRAHQYVRAA